MKQTGLKIFSVGVTVTFLFIFSFNFALASCASCVDWEDTAYKSESECIAALCPSSSSGCGSSCVDWQDEGYTSQSDCVSALCGSNSDTSGSSGGTAQALQNPLGSGMVNPAIILGNVINAALGLVGSLALAVFIFGGFMWVTSAGNDEKIKKGKDMIMWATLGLAVIFASYAMVTFVIGAITGSTGAGTTVSGTTPKAEATTPK